MGSIRKRGNRYEIQIRKKDIHLSKSFRLKSDALAWARKIESEIDQNTYIKTPINRNLTINDLFDRFESEVVPLYRSKQSTLGHIKRQQVLGC